MTVGFVTTPLTTGSVRFFIWFINEITFQVRAALLSVEIRIFCSGFLSRLKIKDSVFVTCGFNLYACRDTLILYLEMHLFIFTEMLCEMLLNHS